MKKILVNYNFTPEKDWLGDDYLIYDRSDSKEWLKDFPQDKIVYTENVGNADYDRLCYLIDNYHDLPDVFLWSKSNLFKYISKEEYELVKDNQFFTPLLTMNHQQKMDRNGWICYYAMGIYWECNDNWYLNQFLPKYFQSYNEFARAFQLQTPPYIPFAPGGNYILTRETVHRYGLDYYKKLASILPYCQLPAEAQMVERAYYSIWK